MQCWQFWLSAFSHQLRHGNRPSTLDPEGTPVPRSCPRKKLARTGRSTLQPAGMPALPFHAPGVGNGGVGENATFRHGLPCRGKVHRPVTGPQMRGTGGTLIKLGERHRDRGHPPLNFSKTCVDNGEQNYRALLLSIWEYSRVAQIDGTCNLIKHPNFLRHNMKVFESLGNSERVG